MATTLKTVCVIGAGPAGLTAAKTLTHNFPQGTFKVTLVDKAKRIGGLWPSSQPQPNAIHDESLMSPDMSLNQSRHTVSFSDLTWPEDALQFPTMWETGQYLERYAKTYGGYEVCLGCEITDVRPTVPENLLNTKWLVFAKDNYWGEMREFDHVIIASGYFGRPKIPDTFKVGDWQAPLRHSLEVRDVYHLLTTNGQSKENGGKKIVVVGGQFSGVDIAGCIAQQLSSAANSPKDSRLSKLLPNASEYTIHHVIQRPFWMLPLWVPRDPILGMGTPEQTANPAPSIVPLDIGGFYNLSFRPAGPLQNGAGHVNEEGARFINGILKMTLGNEQKDMGIKGLEITDEVMANPCYLGASDSYQEFVRSGSIKIHRGRVINPVSGSLNSILVDDKYEMNSQYVIDDVAAVIFGTGFEACTSVSFFNDENLKKAFHFDNRAKEFPVALNVESTTNVNVPSLGFVGFYRSPYWAVMEMQARFLGKLWSGDAHAANTLAEDNSLGQTISLRTDPRRAQFPMGDYAFTMEHLREATSMTRTEPDDNPDSRTGVVLACRYIFPDATEEQRKEAAKSLEMVNKIYHESETKGKFVKKGIFRGLQGVWKVERDFVSQLSTFPSGKFEGTATFHPRLPTEEGWDLEYLYVEIGKFTTEQGETYNVTRRYAYRYRELTDTLSVYFISSKDNLSIDYLFHDMELQMPDLNMTEEQKRTTGWKAKAHHLCIKDTYDVEYEFRFQGVHVREWFLGYDVKGPNKEYGIKSRYVRYAHGEERK